MSWRDDALAWWTSPEWRAYECAYGDAEGDRARLLASATWNTRIIDLGLEERVLWRDTRKSYHSLINKATTGGSLRVHAERFSVVVSTVCRTLHERAAGRVTRSMRTWHLQREWVDNGRAVCMIANADSRDDTVPLVDRLRTVGFAYAVINGSWAYYFSGATVEDNVQHALQWRLILELKARGVTTYEIGWQGHAEDEKGKAIEFFKRGFGGADVPAVLIGEAK